MNDIERDEGEREEEKVKDNELKAVAETEGRHEN